MSEARLEEGFAEGHTAAAGASPGAAAQGQVRHQRAGLLHAIQSMLVLTCIALFVITFTLQPFRIPSASMEPTLLVGDFLLVDKQASSFGGGGMLPARGLHRGDIIVFHDPVNPALHLIKRIVGVPGDRIRLRRGRVILNGRPLVEAYAVYRASDASFYRDEFPNASTPDPDVDSAWWIQMHGLVDRGELVVPAESFFVLGDNRNDSVDSRYWGFVPRAAIVGRPFLIYLSLRMKDDDPDSESDENAHSVQAEPRGLWRFARWDRTLTVVH